MERVTIVKVMKAQLPSGFGKVQSVREVGEDVP